LVPYNEGTNVDPSRQFSFLLFGLLACCCNITDEEEEEAFLRSISYCYKCCAGRLASQLQLYRNVVVVAHSLVVKES